MATVNATISRVRIPPDLSYTITVSLYYKEYYATDFILIDTGVPLDSDGNILLSPLPTITGLQTDEKYVIKAVNEMCSSEYFQDLFITTYCPVGYQLSDDETYCLRVTITNATPPTTPETLIAQPNTPYTNCGSYIYSAGYNQNGTGTSAQIPTTNPFWINWDGITQCIPFNDTDGPLNRSGLWVGSSPADGQTIGFSVCVNIIETKTYYIGISCDNYGTIKLDGVNIVVQNVAALDIQYPQCGANKSCFKIWHIYPVEITAGSHILELLGTNITLAASLGAEIYDNTSAEIIAATDYTGLNLIFSTKDYFGTSVQISSDGTGYSCPDGYALQACSSPYVCVKIETTDVIIG